LRCREFGLALATVFKTEVGLALILD